MPAHLRGTNDLRADAPYFDSGEQMMQRVTDWQWRCPAQLVQVCAFAIFAICMSTQFSSTCYGQLYSYTKATTNRAAREDAIRGIPFHNLSQQAQQRIAAVVRKPTMFRRMPVTSIRCDPELHRFSIRQPEVIVSIWQLMGITQVTAQRTAPYVLKCNDGVGTVTDMELIYGDNDTHVILCEGSYDGPLFRKPLKGRCVLVLRSGAKQQGAGYQITNMLDVFVQVDHAGLDIFAKTLHPLLGKSADINFTESMRFMEKMSRAAENNSEGMQHMIGRLQDLQPKVRDNFKQVVSNVNARYAHEIASRSLSTAKASQLPIRTR